MQYELRQPKNKPTKTVICFTLKPCNFKLNTFHDIYIDMNDEFLHKTFLTTKNPDISFVKTSARIDHIPLKLELS